MIVFAIGLVGSFVLGYFAGRESGSYSVDVQAEADRSRLESANNYLTKLNEEQAKQIKALESQLEGVRTARDA